MQKLHGYGFNDNMEDPPPFFVRRWAPMVNQENTRFTLLQISWCLMLDAHDSCAVASVKFSCFLLFVTFSAFLSGTFIHWILWKAVTKLIYIINYGTYVFFHSLWRFPKIYIFLLHRKADKICFPLNVFSLTESFGMHPSSLLGFKFTWVTQCFSFLSLHNSMCSKNNLCNYSFKLIIFIEILKWITL